MKKILIVDDQLEVRELVSVTLRMGDYKIFQAKSGKEAIEMVNTEKPDLVIMDVMMPGEIDGLQATRFLKNKTETKNTIIIMLTAKGQEFDKKLGFEAGADDYFIKPFSPLDLIRKVEDILKE
jgi:two-component system, OmpR family, phosphate regulon response regulator PhoB